MGKFLFRKKFLLLSSVALIAGAIWQTTRHMPADATADKAPVRAFVARICTLENWDFFGWWSEDTSENATTETQAVAENRVEEQSASDSTTQTAKPVVATQAKPIAMPAVERFPLATEKTTSDLPSVLVSRPELLLPKYAKHASPTAVVTDKTPEKTPKAEPVKTADQVKTSAQTLQGQTTQATGAQTPTAPPKGNVVPAVNVPTSAETRKDKDSAAPQTKGNTTPGQKSPSNTPVSTQMPKGDQLFTKIVEAYIYAYPLVLMNEIQKEMTDSVFFAPANQMAYIPVLPGPHVRTTECPNVDALTSVAWFDLEKEPQVILFPKEPEHAYVLELLDAWTNVIDSFGQAKAEGLPVRRMNKRDMKYLVLCGPNCKLKFPKDLTVIQSPTNSVWLINRVLLGEPRRDGSPDVTAAARTLYEFDVMPWSSYVKMISDSSRSDAQTRLLHYLNSQSLSRYAASPMRMPLTLNTDFSLLKQGRFILGDDTPSGKSEDKKDSKQDDDDDSESDDKKDSKQNDKDDSDSDDKKDSKQDDDDDSDSDDKKDSKQDDDDDSDSDDKKDSKQNDDDDSDSDDKKDSKQDDDDDSDSDDEKDSKQDDDDDSDSGDKDKTKRSKKTAPTDKNGGSSVKKQIDAAAQAVEKSVTEQTEKAIDLDAPSSDEIESEIDQDLESSTPTPYVIWQPYRTRLGFVRYAQTVTMQSVPKAQASGTSPKADTVQEAVSRTTKETASEIKEVSKEAAQAGQKLEQKADTLRNRAVSDIKAAEKTVEQAVEHGSKDAKAEVDAAVSRTEQVSADLMKYIKGVWLKTKDFSKEGLNYGKDALDYFDRKAKRDYRHLERVWSEFADSHKWRQRPETRVNDMTPVEFFTEFAELIKKNPPAPADTEMLSTLKELGITAGESLNVEKMDTKVLQAMQFAVPFARGKLRQSAVYGMFREPEQNNWIVFRNFGHYGTDYLRRAVVANEFMGANIEKEILYPFAFFDADGRLLDGNNDYILHFPPGATPPTETLWSVTLYDSDHYLTANRWKRYAVRSNMPLVYNPDGSLDIMIQRKVPELMTSNWLPAPEGPFMLMMRIYRPDESVLSGKWKIPGVTIRVKK